MNMASKMKVVSENAKKSSTRTFIEMLFSEIRIAAGMGNNSILKEVSNTVHIDAVKQVLIEEGFEVKLIDEEGFEVNL